MKQSKLVVVMELASLLYMLAVLWMLFPQWREPIAKAYHQALYRWRIGRDQGRFSGRPLWMQEMAQVRGRFEPRERAPRPLNLPL
jgi:hypothetical protein